jgi:hypothetical protein
LLVANLDIESSGSVAQRIADAIGSRHDQQQNAIKWINEGPVQALDALFREHGFPAIGPDQTLSYDAVDRLLHPPMHPSLFGGVEEAVSVGITSPANAALDLLRNGKGKALVRASGGSITPEMLGADLTRLARLVSQMLVGFRDGSPLPEHLLSVLLQIRGQCEHAADLLRQLVPNSNGVPAPLGRPVSKACILRMLPSVNGRCVPSEDTIDAAIKSGEFSVERHQRPDGKPGKVKAIDLNEFNDWMIRGGHQPIADRDLR